MVPKKFLTADDIRELYGIEETLIQELVDAGELKALPDRGVIKFRREDVESLIRSGRLMSSAELDVVDDIDLGGEIGFATETDETDRADFLELDEEALSGQSTVISTGPLPEDPSGIQLSFSEDPTQAASSSEVHVFEPTEEERSDSDIVIREPAAADSASHSDVQAIDESSSSDVDVFGGSAIDEDEPFTGAPPDSSETIALGEEPPPVEASTDFFNTLDLGDAEVGEEPAEETAAAADFEQTLIGETSAIADDEADALVFDEGDIGLTLDTGDSGITLDTGDSGITLDTGDSGITLDMGDSGISLEASDSGLSLKFDDDDEEVAAPVAVPSGRSDRTEEMDIDDLDALGLADDGGATAMFATSDVDDEEVSVNDTVETDTHVEDLELTDELDEELTGDDEFLGDDDEIIDADDEAFSDEFSGEMDAEDDDEELLTPTKAKAAPREPGWGVFPSVMVIAAAVVIGLNGWLMWEGMSTMWSGAEPSEAAQAIISSIASLG